MTEEELRTAIEAALRLNDNPPIWPRGWERQLEKLLPVVRRYAARELREAADQLELHGRFDEPTPVLIHARADALEADA